MLKLVRLLFGDWTVYFLVVPALLTARVTVAFSYHLYERLERDGGPCADPGA